MTVAVSLLKVSKSSGSGKGWSGWGVSEHSPGWPRHGPVRPGFNGLIGRGPRRSGRVCNTRTEVSIASGSLVVGGVAVVEVVDVVVVLLVVFVVVVVDVAVVDFAVVDVVVVDAVVVVLVVFVVVVLVVVVVVVVVAVVVEEMVVVGSSLVAGGSVTGGSVGLGGDLSHSNSPSHGHPIGQYVWHGQCSYLSLNSERVPKTITAFFLNSTYEKALFWDAGLLTGRIMFAF